MVNLIFSHIIVFILGMVVMAQMFALNQPPRSRQRPPEATPSTDEAYVLRKALFHLMEANGWLSCTTYTGQIDYLPTFIASLEAMLRRRIASIDASQQNLLRQLSDPALGQPWPSTTNCTTPTEHHGHD